MLYTDTSCITGWVSVLEPPNEATRLSVGRWASQEVLEMIALKELNVCHHSLHQNVETLRGLTVKFYQDNQSVSGALRKMSSKCPALMSERSLTSYLVSTKTRSVSKWSTFETNQTWWMLHHDNGA